MQRTRTNSTPWLFLLPLALAAVMLVGCGSEKSYALGKQGSTLESIPVPFSGQSKMGKMRGDEYRYFRYESEADALADKTKVSSDGLRIANVRYDWGGPVHFYYTSRRIVIYVGDNEKTIGVIQSVFGPQFAGTPE